MRFKVQGCEVQGTMDTCFRKLQHEGVGPRSSTALFGAAQIAQCASE